MAKYHEYRVVAKYLLRWFDHAWNQIGKDGPPLTAHEMCESIEAWNRHCQQSARDDALVVPDADCPCHVSIEVVYVQVEKVIPGEGVNSRKRP